MTQNSDTLEYDYRVLQLIEERPDISQRELASQLGVSVGKTNYVLSALIVRGLVKAENFKRSNNKSGYLYLLTPKGISDKGVITARFLKRKVEEYERLKAEIADIQSRIEEWVLRTKNQNWVRGVALEWFFPGQNHEMHIRQNIAFASIMTHIKWLYGVYYGYN